MPSQVQRGRLWLVVRLKIAPQWQAGMELQDPPFALSLRTKHHLMDETESETFWAWFFCLNLLDQKDRAQNDLIVDCVFPHVSSHNNQQ
jgi:hypothetical protein